MREMSKMSRMIRTLVIFHLPCVRRERRRGLGSGRDTMVTVFSRELGCRLLLIFLNWETLENILYISLPMEEGLGRKFLTCHVDISSLSPFSVTYTFGQE